MLLAVTLAAQLVTAQIAPRPEKLHLVPAWVPMVAAFDTHVLLVGVTSIVAFTMFPQPRCGCVPSTGGIIVGVVAVGGWVALSVSALVASVVMKNDNRRRRAERVTFDGVTLRV